ncbi:phosphatidylinositol N-acetylglucosaminyltransferase subunit Y isoform X2 [Psammomys obesus]|uniref:phosphatidylinositol N-acetylglucosaminyltransferase subunit Y isoform X2 n=1 Tax=Psammomys obesus TaxID=48139 RepID=UPI0024532695|nr:phosphatidylinositol N-acetylglucosaminyltransferase subunit Y isoform X2 [Psammomys obesus]
MLPSLPTLTVLIPLVSLAGLFYSASVEEGFPQGCTSASSLCFYSLLLPVTVPVYVFFHRGAGRGLKLFRHNGGGGGVSRGGPPPSGLADSE